MMKTSWFGLGCLIFLVAAPCLGADIGIVTLVDGKPKVLRGTAWFILSEGVRVRDGDTLVVPKLDRLARSVPDARDIGDGLAARGIKLSLGGQVYDPTDPMGKMFFNILATFAEFSVIWTRRDTELRELDAAA